VARQVAGVTRHAGIDKHSLPADLQLETQCIVVAMAAAATQSHVTEIGKEVIALIPHDVNTANGEAEQSILPRGQCRSVRGPQQPDGCRAFWERSMNRDAEHHRAERDELARITCVAAIEREHARAVVVAHGRHPSVRPGVRSGVSDRRSEPIPDRRWSGATRSLRGQEGQQAQLRRQSVVPGRHLVVDAVR